jgi:hypothetical protein
LEFITTGSTVMFCVAKSAAFFSISPIWTMQDWQLAPSAK